MNESVGKCSEKLSRLNDRGVRVEDQLATMETRLNEIDDTVGKVDDQVAHVDEQLLKSEETIAKVLEQVEITAEDSRGIRVRVEDNERYGLILTFVPFFANSKQPRCFRKKTYSVDGWGCGETDWWSWKRD